MSFQPNITITKQSFGLRFLFRACLLMVGLGSASIGCTRQPELIAPAAKATDEKSADENAAQATELAQNASPNSLTPDGNAKKVQADGTKESDTDTGVQPASHVVDLKNPPRVQRSSMAGPAHVAKVLLSDSEKALCKVKVGDQVPEVSLPNLTGDTQAINKLLGEKLTVLLFWSPTDPFSTWFLSDLTPDAFEPYNSLGLNVVGVCSGTADESVETSAAQKAAETAGAKFPILVDADGEAISKFGTDRSSRVYLLDSQGKIVWFDIEYSRSTRRDLSSALAALLEPVNAKNPVAPANPTPRVPKGK